MKRRRNKPAFRAHPNMMRLLVAVPAEEYSALQQFAAELRWPHKLASAAALAIEAGIDKRSCLATPGRQIVYFDTSSAFAKQLRDAAEASRMKLSDYTAALLERGRAAIEREKAEIE